MACKKGLSREEKKHRNVSATAAAAPSVASSDALLLAMMCIVGIPVDVHVKDGSIYSGIFHTASVDNDYAIVLKKVRMTKKGNQETNIVNGSLIETLIVQWEDLVQVVAKGIPLPSNKITGHIQGDDTEDIAGHSACLDRDANEIKTDESKSHRRHKSQKRFLARKENNAPCGTTINTAKLSGAASKDHNQRLSAINFVKVEESQNISRLEREVEDYGSHEIQNSNQQSHELEADVVQESNLSSDSCESQSTASVNILEERNTQQKTEAISPGCSAREDQCHEALEEIKFTEAISPDCSAHEDQCHEALEETKFTVTCPPNVSGPTNSGADIDKRSVLNAASNSFGPLPLQNSSLKKSTRVSKLNPGAKIFSPSTLHYELMTPPVPIGGTVSYMPDAYAMGPITSAQQEVEASSFAHAPTPAKFVPYDNISGGNEGNGVHYVQPIIGQVVNRTQPVRYTGQLHSFQTGTGCVHPNPQNVMLGRMRPLVCMHPISNDALQSAAGFSPATTRPLLNPHQMYLLKHQGIASAQSLPLSMTPPILAGGQQSFVMPSSIAVSPPLLPVLRPITFPGTNGLLGSKFA